MAQSGRSLEQYKQSVHDMNSIIDSRKPGFQTVICIFAQGPFEPHHPDVFFGSSRCFLRIKLGLVFLDSGVLEEIMYSEKFFGETTTFCSKYFRNTGANLHRTALGLPPRLENNGADAVTQMDYVCCFY